MILLRDETFEKLKNDAKLLDLFTEENHRLHVKIEKLETKIKNQTKEIKNLKKLIERKKHEKQIIRS